MISIIVRDMTDDITNNYGNTVCFMVNTRQLIMPYLVVQNKVNAKNYR